MDIENAKKHLSELQEERRKYKITLPTYLKTKTCINELENDILNKQEKEALEKFFPSLIKNPILQFGACENSTMNLNDTTDSKYLQTVSTKLSTDVSSLNITHNSLYKEMIQIPKKEEYVSIGIVLTGNQAPGGHNIICGILDNLKKKSRNNVLYGFLNGFEGMKKYDFMELKNEYLSMFRNIGGFDMIKTSPLVINGEIDKKKCFKICRRLNLNGLVIVGGVNSHNGIAELAEYFSDVFNKATEIQKKKEPEKKEELNGEIEEKKLVNDVEQDTTASTHNHTKEGEVEKEIKKEEPTEENEIELNTYEIVSDFSDEEIKKRLPQKKKHFKKTSIISVPKTVYGDFQNDYVECSLGFDTTVFAYCQYISYLISHVQTYRKGYHIIKVLGGKSSNVVLECFLQTKVNLVLIGEEIKKENLKISDVTNIIVNAIKTRYTKNKNKHGIILIPEGLLRNVKEFKTMINTIIEIKETHVKNNQIGKKEFRELLKTNLKKEILEQFESFPEFFKMQIITEVLRNGCKLKYERLCVEKLFTVLVKQKLKDEEEVELKRIEIKNHYYGNECTCTLPTNFDCAYSYILGFSCVELIEKGYTGYTCVIKNLKHILFDVNKINIMAIPICSFMKIKQRKGKEVYTMKRKKVDLQSDYFLKYKKYRKELLYEDRYRTLSGIQYLNAPTENNNTLDLSKKINNFLGNELNSIHFKENNICNRVNFMISELKNDYLEIQNNSNEQPSHCNYYRSENMLSEIEKLLIKSIIKFNTILIRHNTRISLISTNYENKLNYEAFSHIQNIKEFYTVQENSLSVKSSTRSSVHFKNVGVALLSENIPASNNIVLGLHQRLSIHNYKLIGFIKGIKGILTNDVCAINDNSLKNCVNIGGFPLLGVQEDYEMDIEIELQDKKKENKEGEKKEKENEQKEEETHKHEVKKIKRKVTIYDLIKEEYIKRIIETCNANNLKYLVFIGDEKVISLMNILNDIFISKELDIKIITVPVSLYNSFDKNLIECSIGYHSMVRNISDVISNLQSDCLNVNKYYYVVKVHTNISSALILSIQLETHCNICIIGESLVSQLTTFKNIVEDITVVILERINRMKYYGVILFSSNLIYCINDFYELCKDVDANIKTKDEIIELIKSETIPEKYESKLKKESIDLLKICTPSVKEKLLIKEKRENEDIDANFEIMLINEVKKNMKELIDKSKENKTNESYSYKKHMHNLTGPITANTIKIYNDIDYMALFQTIIKNIDREINCAIPTHFDNSLAYSHGLLAGIAVENDLVNYVTSIRHLNLNKNNWSSSLYPGYYFINNKDMNGHFDKYPHVAPIPTSVKSSQMATVNHNADTWTYSDCYIYVGSVQHALNTDSFGCSYIF